ncbi:hypothetical protein GCM10022393_37720 [Aquimarina addita]|uniref:Uncharacterized protein n=1 Tax=Aquimarina addita TaxID=870485 RepID=A0ABP6USN4_9FLAO
MHNETEAFLRIVCVISPFFDSARKDEKSDIIVIKMNVDKITKINLPKTIKFQYMSPTNQVLKTKFCF